MQVLTYDRGLHVESVGDAFLDVDEKLTDAEQARLTELGWTPPDGEPPNWHRTWDTTPTRTCAARLLVDTLVDVHGLDSIDELGLTIAETIDPFADQPPETT